MLGFRVGEQIIEIEENRGDHRQSHPNCSIMTCPSVP
jgi:hypothetical protein